MFNWSDPLFCDASSSNWCCYRYSHGILLMFSRVIYHSSVHQTNQPVNYRHQNKGITRFNWINQASWLPERIILNRVKSNDVCCCTPLPCATILVGSCFEPPNHNWQCFYNHTKKGAQIVWPVSLVIHPMLPMLVVFLSSLDSITTENTFGNSLERIFAPHRPSLLIKILLKALIYYYLSLALWVKKNGARLTLKSTLTASTLRATAVKSALCINSA